MKVQKQLPKARQRYYVDEPVVVIPLAQFERLANHMTDIAMLDQKTMNQQLAVKSRHSLILKEARAEIKAAKSYYKIKATKPDTDA
ncbi:hypothetical protein GCM10028808_73210 [Spirosoma migulaei]